MHFDELGIVNDNLVEFDEELNLSVEILNEENKTWLNNYMIN